ncbi:stalk domain-containing protein [Cohnella sp.]|uniref:stalk domain-containing protein n=1 Tax=Cohnella sp. TaxID=1883426 RepID=UPI003561E87E
MKLWGKTALSLLLGITIISGASIMPQVTAAAAPIEIVLDDVPLSFNVAPMIQNSVTVVPFRTIAQALGINVEWDNANSVVRAQGIVNGVLKKVVLKIGQKTATVDGKSVRLITPPVMVNARVLIPLSFFSTQFGANVGWSNETKTVSIKSPKKQMHLRAFYALGSFQQRARISSMDSVAFGWSRINENGELVLDGDDYYWPEAAGEVTPESLIKDSASQGAKPYLMVYSVDGKGELTKMLSDETLRNRSIANMAALVRDMGFGGVVLDLEGLGLNLDPLQQQKLLNNYVKLLVDQLSPLGATVSVAVPPPNGSYKGYDYKTLAGLAEDLILMAYDFHPPGTPDHTPEPNAKVEEAISLMLEAGVPKNKLILGISFGSEFVFTVDDKLGLAKRYGLKGASFWVLKLYSDEFANEIDRVVEKVGK